MAYSTTKIDENRGSNSIALPADLSQSIIAKAVEQSAVMRLAQRIDLPGRGVSVPVIVGDVEAAWTVESTEKHVGTADYSLKTMTPYKAAVIELFSNEFKRDIPGLYAELERRLPGAVAKLFDATVLTGTAPGSNFDVLSGSTAMSIATDSNANVYQKLVSVLEAIGANGYSMNGIAIAPQGQAILLGAVDGDGRPLFLTDITAGNGVGRILGSDVATTSAAYKAGTSPNKNLVGIAGDWSQARYGIVNGIEVSFSDQATVNDGTNQVNLWQRNMFALRVEAEFGFVVADDDAFVALTD